MIACVATADADAQGGLTMTDHIVERRQLLRGAALLPLLGLLAARRGGAAAG